MVKNILIVGAVVLGIVALVFGVRWLLCGWINPFQVERIVLKGGCSCETPSSKTVELSKEEISKVIGYYNCSTSYRGIPDADSCDVAFSITVYYKDGSHMGIYEGARRSTINVSPVWGKRIWVRNDDLAEYLLELIDQYDLHQQ